MIILKRKDTRQPLWWVGEVHQCMKNSTRCTCEFQLEETDTPVCHRSSGDGHHMGPADYWVVPCPQCGAEVIIRYQEV